MKRGRPKKYPQRDIEKQRFDLIQRAVELFGDPYDDRKLRDEEAPSIRSVAAVMGMTSLTIRKALITAGYYTSDLSRKVQELNEKGMSCEEIMNRLNLGRASVNSYLPFVKGIYKLDEPSLYAEQCERYRKRLLCVKKLQEVTGTVTGPEYLWEAIKVFQYYPFYTYERNEKKKAKFEYHLNSLKNGDTGNKLMISTEKKIITRATVEYAYHKAIILQKERGFVSEPKFLDVPGAERYLYPVFLRLGIINTRDR